MPGDGAPPPPTSPGTCSPPAALQSALGVPFGARLGSLTDSSPPPPGRSQLDARPSPASLPAVLCRGGGEGARADGVHGFSFSPGRARGGPARDARRHGEARPSGKWLPRPGSGQGSWDAGLLTAPTPFVAGIRVQDPERDTGRPVKVLFPIWWRADSSAGRGRVWAVRARTLEPESAQLSD